MYMPLLAPPERAFADAVVGLAVANPFLPERVALERAALGADFVEAEPVWSVRSGQAVQNPNVARIAERVEALVATLRHRLVDGAAAGLSEADRRTYEDVVVYLLYQRYEDAWWRVVVGEDDAAAPVGCWDAFRRDVEELLDVPGVGAPSRAESAHLFACLFQVRRAFHHIFRHVIGGSMPMARLRAAVWQSIFTHDVRRYRRALWDRMADVATLVVGPSGTGKELVARAIALSRYVPFEPRTSRFAASFADQFHPLNLSALAPTLVESELFGHARGAFTGALQDRAGRLEECSALGTVFLDEVGDVDPSIQVKLLRVLQTRTFERLGETKPRRFEGKIVAATNRDLAAEIGAGRFREDFYYRLCSDIVTTPTLADQLRASPDELANLVDFLARRIVGEEEAAGLAAEVCGWIARELGDDYRWPGNVRELEQCVRNVLVRGAYRPHVVHAPEARKAFAGAVAAGTLTADELLSRYCTLVYADTGSYQETARRLGLDRRTVKAKVDAAQVEALRR
jgi:DNA-binding NtrC family response regulator